MEWVRYVWELNADEFCFLLFVLDLVTLHNSHIESRWSRTLVMPIPRKTEKLELQKCILSKTKVFRNFLNLWVLKIQWNLLKISRLALGICLGTGPWKMSVVLYSWTHPLLRNKKDKIICQNFNVLSFLPRLNVSPFQFKGVVPFSKLQLCISLSFLPGSRKLHALTESWAIFSSARHWFSIPHLVLYKQISHWGKTLYHHYYVSQ